MRKPLLVGVAVLIAVAPIPYPQVVHARTQEPAVNDESEPPRPLALEEVLQPEYTQGNFHITVGKSNQELQDEAALAEEEKNRTIHTPAINSGDSSSAISIAFPLVSNEFGSKEWQSFYELINIESGWSVTAQNPSSGACGLPQALPCSKLPEGIKTSIVDQISWTITYIKNRYGTPSQALAFHRRMGWY